MKTLLLTGFAVATLALVPAPASPDLRPAEPPATRADTLAAFPSEAEFRAFLRKHVPPRPIFRRQSADGPVVALESVAAVGYGAQAAPSITNVQHAGVDEGGIVKLHGDHLVILRRGRLFTVAVGDDSLTPVSAVDAFGPDVDPAGAWYDELIIHGNVVAVVGYSYQRGGTEVGLFAIDRNGQLRHRSTYQLRSNDYYSSRNYASRLVGSKLVFYAPVPIRSLGSDPVTGLPALRRWQGRRGDGEFVRILPPTRVYHAGLPEEPTPDLVLHTVTSCDLSRAELACDASAVAGPAGRVFYVSPSAVYVWTTDRRRGHVRVQSAAMLYRMPLDGSAPSALGAEGSPVDQFSFLEDDRGHLNVLVRSDAAGDGMWQAEAAQGDVALLRVPLSRFSDGSRSAERGHYRALPAPSGRTFQNRFVGRHLLYGTGSGWGFAEKRATGTLYVVPLGGGEASALVLEHGVDRIEVLGRNAVVVGSGGSDLHFTSVRLGQGVSIVDSYVEPGAAQGELRSHGFFYRDDGRDAGILGLPMRQSGDPGYVHIHRGSAGVIFLRAEGARFRSLGQLSAGEHGVRDDACRASCVDWYGNARPLFLHGRVFALLGYEIVEGQVRDGGIRERRRISFAPEPSRWSRAPSH